MAGAVCGDHISPISDTTILSSTGARCNHLEHVSTQIPYAMVVAGSCLVGYVLGGVLHNGYIALAIGAAVLLVAIANLFFSNRSKQPVLVTADGAAVDTQSDAETADTVTADVAAETETVTTETAAATEEAPAPAKEEKKSKKRDDDYKPLFGGN